MDETALEEQMKADGVRLDFKQNIAFFKHCNQCLREFSELLKPVLLECGHFICQTKSCLAGRVCSQCNKTLKMKHKPYETLLSLLKLQDQKTQSNLPKLYNFIIFSDASQKKRIVFDISEDNTLGSIISLYFNKKKQNPFEPDRSLEPDGTGVMKTLKGIFNYFFKSHTDTNSTRIFLVINNYSTFYENIKSKTIKEYNQFMEDKYKGRQQKLFKNDADRINQNYIRIAKLYCGGAQ